jgi:hypothetical protein
MEPGCWYPRLVPPGYPASGKGGSSPRSWGVVGASGLAWGSGLARRGRGLRVGAEAWARGLGSRCLALGSGELRLRGAWCSSGLGAPGGQAGRGLLTSREEKKLVLLKPNYELHQVIDKSPSDTDWTLYWKIESSVGPKKWTRITDS